MPPDVNYFYRIGPSLQKNHFFQRKFPDRITFLGGADSLKAHLTRTFSHNNKSALSLSLSLSLSHTHTNTHTHTHTQTPLHGWWRSDSERLLVILSLKTFQCKPTSWKRIFLSVSLFVWPFCVFFILSVCCSVGSFSLICVAKQWWTMISFCQGNSSSFKFSIFVNCI